MVRAAFLTFLIAFSGLVFGQSPGVTLKTILLGQALFVDLTMIGRGGGFLG